MTLPVVIEVDAGASGGSSVGAASAAALAPPAGSARVPGTPVPAAAADPEAVRDTVLRIVLGQEVKQLRCRQEDVTGFVGMSYIAGGFPMVIAARRAIEAGIQGLADDTKSRQSSLAQLERMAADTDHPFPGATAAAALPEARSVVDRSRQTTQRAQASHASYSEYFRLAWNAVAAYEEQLLRRYDRELAVALKKVAAQNKELAAAEWAKYAPSPKDTSTKVGFETAQADDIATLGLNKAIADKLAPSEKKPAGEAKPTATDGTSDGSAKPAPDAAATDGSITDEQRTKAIEGLWRIALDLFRQADAIRTNRRIAPQVAAKDTRKQTALKKQAFGDLISAWNTARQEVARDYPVLLQVYPAIGSVNEANTLRGRMPKAIAGALLRTRDECVRIAGQTIPVWGSVERLRVIPVPDTRADGAFLIPQAELDRPIGTRTQTRRFGREADTLERNVPLRTVLEADHLRAATTFGLTIPSSEVFAGLLKWDENRRRNSGWLHAPAGFELMRRAAAEAELAPYFGAGTIAHAAVSRVLDALAAQREREKTWAGRGMMLMWGSATLLAPFTDGATLYGAALVQASVSAHEIYQSVVEYQDAASLSAVSLTAVEEASWRRPSTVNLVRTIVADAADVVQNTVGARGLPIALDIALGALSMIHPDEPSTGPTR